MFTVRYSDNEEENIDLTKERFISETVSFII